MNSRPALSDCDPVEVGRRVRGLREAQGVSLSQLAKRAGIGKATLSGVENGRRNPTLETLWAITAQLGVPIGAILDEPPKPEDGLPISHGPVVHGAAVEATLLETFEEADAVIELFRLLIPPGTTQRSQPHHSGVSEHITVFRGRLVAGPVSGPFTAGPGDHLTWVADVPHLYRAEGQDIVEASLLIRYPRAR
jgi:XRE family transcriptional regulator, regulator of sulfur utilization